METPPASGASVDDLKDSVKRLLEDFSRTEDVGSRKDVMNSIGAIAYDIGTAFEEHMPMFLSAWISGLKKMRAGEVYDAMVVLMIRITRALKGKIRVYCRDIVSQLHEDLLSTDLHKISKCSILCCYAELTLAIGEDFHKHLKPTMKVFKRLTSSKDLLSKPEGRHLICAGLEIYFAIIQCFEWPFKRFASEIIHFLRFICRLDMDARVTTAAIIFVQHLVVVPGDIFSSSIYEDKIIQNFLHQSSISEDPLIEACAKWANSRLLGATYNLRCTFIESEVSEKHLRPRTLNPVQDQENKYSEKELLDLFYKLPQGADSYETNSITYESLSHILSKDEEDVAERILAGKVLLIAMRSEKKWDRLSYSSRFRVSKYLVQTLFSSEKSACLMAIDICNCIGSLSKGFGPIWIELEEILFSDASQKQLHLEDCTLKMLADLLKKCGSYSGRPYASLINKLCNATSEDDKVIINCLQILQYSYCSPQQLSDDIRNFIFDATNSSSVKVKVAALECLTALCSRYEFNLGEQSKIRTVMLEAMKETDKYVAYQAIVFWIAVCQKEMRADIRINFVKETSSALVTNLSKILFTQDTQLLEPTDPNEEPPNLVEAAFNCLHFVAQTIGDEIIGLLNRHVVFEIESSDVSKGPSIQAFGSILVGPSDQALSSLFSSAFSKVLHSLKGCTDNSVSYAITWTLSQIFEFHHQIYKKRMVSEYQHVIHFLQLRINDDPIVAKNACRALSSLVQGVDAYIWDKLSPHFDVLVHSLYAVGNNGSSGDLELKVAAYEALHEFMKCANDENFKVMLSLTSCIISDLSCALEAKEYTIEELKNQCRSLLVITQKLGTSEKCKCTFRVHVHEIIPLLTRVLVLECKSVIVWMEAMLALGAIAYVNGGAFEEHMGQLEACWEVGVKIFEQNCDAYLVMLSVIVDVSRVLKEKMLQFCDKFILPLSIDASNCQRKENWGPSISCICEIAREVGDKQFLKRAMGMLHDKTWFGIDRTRHFNVLNILYLLPGLVEAYRAIFEALENYSVFDPLHRFTDDTLDVLDELSNLLYQTDDMDNAITRGVIEVFERLAKRKMGSSMSRQKYVDHLSKPFLKQLVLSFQNESWEKKNMNLVCGNPVVMYAVHVKTEQPEGGLYGRIEVNSQCLYDQERGDAEPVCSEETALFVNALEIIPGGEGVTLEVDLKHKAGDGGASTDDEVFCRNKTTIWSGGDGHKGYNQPLEATVEGKNGSVRISFIEFDHTAYVKVTVETPPEGIHGQITAYNMSYPSIKRELFGRKDTNEIILTKNTYGELILYKGVVSVPLNSVLIVKADLWRSMVGRQSSIPYMKFAAEFNVKRDGSTSKVCRGTMSTIVIEVFFGI